jgi:glycosyltransferase involved in cell wall biosynthesis
MAENNWEGTMTLFQLWTVATGVLFLGLAWRTWRFAYHLLSLQYLPNKFSLSEAQKRHEDSGTWPLISMVIPGCNEGETIEAALHSLLQVDYPHLEIVLVNDRSTDQTGAVMDQFALMDRRVKVVHVQSLPAGWLGKVHALDRGLSVTTGEWILFSDADVHFAADALKNAIVFCLKDHLDFLTAIPEVVTRSSVLQVVIAQLFHQASLFFNPKRINDPAHRACYGQGAFMLLRKSMYLRSERLEWLKMEVVDDTGLALLMRRAGARMGAVSGLNQIRIEWYPSVQAFLKGIEKNAFAFSQYSLGILLSFTGSLLMVFLGFTVAPWFCGSSAYGLFSSAALLLYVFAIHHQLKVMMKVKPWTAFVFPLSFVILPLLFLRASLITLRRGGVNWRGTFYSLKTLKENQRMKLANLVFTTAAQPLREAFEVDVAMERLG